MKRVQPDNEIEKPVYLFDAGKLWQFAEQMGISQELKDQLQERAWTDPEILRTYIALMHPRDFEVLKAVERTYEIGTNFMHHILHDLFHVALLPPSAAPVTVPVETPPPVANEDIQKKGAQTKKKRGVDTTTTKLVGGDRTDLIRRHTTRRDILGNADYSREWLSRFAVIGQPVRASDALSDFSTYTTIYHCCTAWGMEEIITLLQDEGYLAFGIRDDTNKSEECVRYKVITNEPYIE
jgi:hypothetical protein